MKLHKISLLFTILISLILLNACNKDYDLNAPYKNITIVYGALESEVDASGDPIASDVYLRIQKAFLGDDPQAIALQDPDATEYNEVLYVELMELKDGDTIGGPFIFDTVYHNKDANGDFSPEKQLLYYKRMYVHEESEYILKILVEGQEISSESIIVENFGISRPGPNESINIIGDNDKIMKWGRPINASSFEVKLNFSYYEVTKDASGKVDTTLKTIDWYSLEKNNVNASEYEIEIYYPTTVFYNSIQVKVPYSDPAMESTVIERFTNGVEYRVNAAADELAKYIAVNSPQEGIFQYRPEYSNIENGYGIFSSRNKTVKFKKLGNETKELIKDLGIKFTY